MTRIYADLLLALEDGGAILHQTSLPMTLEHRPVNHPTPYRCLYASVAGGWRPTALLAAADLLDMVLPHEQGD